MKSRAISHRTRDGLLLMTKTDDRSRFYHESTQLGIQAMKRSIIHSLFFRHCSITNLERPKRKKETEYSIRIIKFQNSTTGFSTSKTLN
jgi:hypothetical protein